ncbi:nitrilase-related carbon-nitrogen hydrolase [Streptomyces nigra]
MVRQLTRAGGGDVVLEAAPGGGLDAVVRLPPWRDSATASSPSSMPTTPALENTVYSVFANPLNGPTDRPCDGTSALYAPDGSTLVRAAPAQDTTLLADLTPGVLAEVRSCLRMLTEHREPAPFRPRATPHAGNAARAG